MITTEAPEVFAAFLGDRMKASCGWFRGPEDTLDTAQEESLRRICAAAELRGGEHVLDLGCGWGGLALFLAEELGCAVTAVTPSAAQADFVAERAHRLGLADRIEVISAPLEAVEFPAKSFDAVAMVEVAHHLPKGRAPLRAAYDVLRRNGILYLSQTCYRGERARREHERGPADARAGRGCTAARTLSDLMAEVEDADFSLASSADLTEHYDTTMRRWQRGLQENRTVVEAVSPGLADALYDRFEIARADLSHLTKQYALTAVRSRLGRCSV
ncbi:SAM-dependent methyltransferase [Nocardia sp. NPDC004068]|uniref:SAM-dependent methyltransferase n=1 Tax=Nocardia sp. NPDC004068 TaxID=3364303 RepID=UPI00367C64AC